jgi:hypothetical protein
VTELEEKIALAAGGTLFGAILSTTMPLIRDVVVGWWKKPKIRLDISNERGHLSRTRFLDRPAIIHTDATRSGTGRPAVYRAGVYGRIKVTNLPRKIASRGAAKGCVCYLAALDRWDHCSDKFVSTTYHDFLRLAWSYNAETTGADLLPATPHWLDVFHTLDGSDAFFLGTATNTTTYGEGFREFGWYRFTIQLSAENFGPKQVYLYLHWHQQWSTFQIIDHKAWKKEAVRLRAARIADEKKRREDEERRAAEKAAQLQAERNAEGGI